MKRRLAVLVLTAVAPVFGSIVIYNNIPSPQPPSLVSQSFQANRDSEFGDLITFGGTARDLTSATVAMVTVGYFSKYNVSTVTNTGGWTEPAITLNLFSVDNSGASPAPGTLLGSVTESSFIPWRPEPTPICGGVLWLAPDGCHNGMAFDITFDFTSLGIVLPNQIIYGIAYNTQSGGQNPIGLIGPYNDLNVGLDNNVINTVQVGSNPNAPLAYLSGIGTSYADGGAGGIGVFRLDTGGSHSKVAIQFAATPEPGTAGMLLGGGLLLMLCSLLRRARGAA
jgi:hypothetical protein